MRIAIFVFVLILGHLSALPRLSDSRAEEPRVCSGTQFSFGIKGGFSFSQHTGTEERDAEYNVSSSWRTGSAAGVFIYVPVTSRFGIQQEVLFVQKGSKQRIGLEILDIPTELDVTYKMDYIEIPVLFRFSWLKRENFVVYGVSGTALSLKIRDSYKLVGEIDDGSQKVPLRADSDMSEVDMFDYSFAYGLGAEFAIWNRKLFIEHRFVIGWNALAMPTYTYVPFGDEKLLIDNEPVSLKNQAHLVLVGMAF